MRSVLIWRGSTDDAPIPKSVRARIWAKYDGRCALTGRKLMPGEADIDHIVPLADGGAHAEENLQLVAKDAHRAKTAAEAGPRAKARRIALKHSGLWPRSKRPIQSRGFEPSRPRVKENASD